MRCLPASPRLQQGAAGASLAHTASSSSRGGGGGGSSNNRSSCNSSGGSSGSGGGNNRAGRRAGGRAATSGQAAAGGRAGKEAGKEAATSAKPPGQQGPHLHDLNLGLAHHVHGLRMVHITPAAIKQSIVWMDNKRGGQVRALMGAWEGRWRSWRGRRRGGGGGGPASCTACTAGCRQACSTSARPLTGQRCPGGRGRAAGTGCSWARRRQRRRQSLGRRRQC